MDILIVIATFGYYEYCRCEHLCIHVFAQAYAFSSLEYIPIQEVELLGHMVTLHLTYGGTARPLAGLHQWLYRLYFLTSNV
jgi:hypothetical protein